MSLIVSNGLGNAAGSYPSCLAFLATSVIGGVQQIIVSLTAPPTVSGPAATPADYILTTTDGRAVTVTGIAIIGSTLVLATTMQTEGAHYVLNMPAVGLVDNNSNPFNGPFTNAFLGVGLPLQVAIAYSVDVITLEIVFNQSVNETSALNIAHYNISPTLAVTNSIKISDSVYQLTTSSQTSGQVYTVTATGVIAA